ncbi:16S rRNA (uracil(1498)-N(3))-methyltransferase [bacterium]|nr:16S rRNA (uracil(1498)-N(3))-methyltransferase [bacterium]
MNMVLFEKNDFISDSEIVISDRRVDYIKSVHKADINSILKIGILNGDIGVGKIVAIDDSSIKFSIEIQNRAPLKNNSILAVALPRPKIVKKILQLGVAGGFSKIIFFKSWSVDKSYWNSPVLEKNEIEKELKLALEQSVDTILPEVEIYKAFKPFAEDIVPNLLNDRDGYLFHPKKESGKIDKISDSILFFGPERGFIQYEVDLLNSKGVKTLSMGDRILRVEQAVGALLGVHIFC